MSRLKRFFASTIIFYLLASLINFGLMSGDAVAGSSQPLTLENAQGESLTVGSVGIVNDGDNVIIDFNTDAEYPLYLTVLTFRGNSWGVQHADSKTRTTFLATRTDNHHRYVVPLTEIKNEQVTIIAAADVIVNGAITNTRKAFITAFMDIPPTTTTTESTTTTTTTPPTSSTKPPSTSTTEEQTETTAPPTSSTVPTSPSTTSSTVPTSPSTTAGGSTGTTAASATSTTVAPTTTSTQASPTTTVAPITTTTIPPTTTTVQAHVTTTVPSKPARRVLPFTGTEHNWYLIGALSVLAGLGFCLGSAGRSR